MSGYPSDHAAAGDECASNVPHNALETATPRRWGEGNCFAKRMRDTGDDSCVETEPDSSAARNEDNSDVCRSAHGVLLDDGLRA